MGTGWYFLYLFYFRINHFKGKILSGRFRINFLFFLFVSFFILSLFFGVVLVFIFHLRPRHQNYSCRCCFCCCYLFHSLKLNRELFFRFPYLSLAPLKCDSRDERRDFNKLNKERIKTLSQRRKRKK